MLVRGLSRTHIQHSKGVWESPWFGEPSHEVSRVVPVSLCPRSIRVCLLFAFRRSEGFAASFAWPALSPPRAPGGFVSEALYEEQVADEPKRLQVAETR